MDFTDLSESQPLLAREGSFTPGLQKQHDPRNRQPQSHKYIHQTE
jgi:hypothetical protein